MLVGLLGFALLHKSKERSIKQSVKIPFALLGCRKASLHQGPERPEQPERLDILWTDGLLKVLPKPLGQCRTPSSCTDRNHERSLFDLRWRNEGAEPWLVNDVRKDPFGGGRTVNPLINSLIVRRSIDKP